MQNIEYSDWFLPIDEPNNVTIGVELELLLFDTKNKEPLNRMDTCESILSEIRSHKNGKNIYRDYYPYQLEIRTTPSIC